MKRVVIIGAGFGGLSAAAYLAKAGHDVTVLEATSQPGGRARTQKEAGFTFDLGPSWYLMPDVFEEWFSHFGHTPQDFYELKKLSPSYKVFTDKRDFSVPTAPDVYEVFDRLEPGAGERLQKLLTKTKQEYAAVRNGLLALDGLRYRQALRPDVLTFLLNPELARSYHSRIASYIHDADLQHVLEFMTVFMGGSPYNIPAYYSLLAHVDMNMGVYYPMGGFGAVAQAFAAVATKAGARIHYNSPVQAIRTTNKRVTGVEIHGQTIACDAVVANADYHHVETNLLPQEARSYGPAYWRQRTMSPSGLVVTAGVKRTIPNILHHNLFFDTDWDAHFREVFTTKQWSQKPLFYLCAPSKTDPSVAPTGHENLFLLAPMAAGSTPDESTLNRTAQNMLARVAAATGCDFTSDITVQSVYGPQYFTQTFHAYQGNAFGLAHTLTQSAVLRPRLQSKRVRNLFYTGQYTNPGTGVPMVIQSGMLAAGLVTKELA